MSKNPNPYRSPVNEVVHGVDLGGISKRDLEKTRAIVKDAGQFWLAILLCILCSALGAVMIGPWYGVRLMQWHSMSKKYPKLLIRNTPPGSLPQRFQSAQWKLWVGLGVGLMMALFVCLVIIIAFIPLQSAVIQ